MTDDLVAFLRARLDEDEHYARAMPGLYEDAGATREANDWGGLSGFGREKRMLRDVEAKRRIIDDEIDVASVSFGRGQEAKRLLALLASVYQDHPDYRADWRL